MMFDEEEGCTKMARKLQFKYLINLQCSMTISAVPIKTPSSVVSRFVTPASRSMTASKEKTSEQNPVHQPSKADLQAAFDNSTGPSDSHQTTAPKPSSKHQVGRDPASSLKHLWRSRRSLSAARYSCQIDRLCRAQREPPSCSRASRTGRSCRRLWL